MLVANGGGPPAGNFQDMTDSQWEEAFETTLMSVTRLVRHSTPQMKVRGRLDGGGGGRGEME